VTHGRGQPETLGSRAPAKERLELLQPGLVEIKHSQKLTGDLRVGYFLLYMHIIA